MANNNDASLSIGLEQSDLTAGLKAAENAVKSSVAQMQSAFGSLEGVVGNVTKAFGILTAALAGGAAFRAIIESTGSWAEGALKLSKSLGVSIETASAYQVALRRLGLDNDIVTSAAEKMSKQIFTNSSAFQKLGVDTKDSQGNFRQVADVMQDVNAKLMAIPNLIERNIAGQQVYGKGWAEVRAVVKLTADVLAEAAVRGKELGLIVGPDGAAQARAYKESLNDVKLVGTALQNELGKELIPTLTQIATAFGDSGPGAAKVFAEALRIVAYVGGTVAIELEKLGKGIGALGAAAVAVLHGDLAGARSIIADLDGDITALNDKAASLWDNLNKPVPGRGGKGAETDGPMPFDSKEKDESQLQVLAAKLEAIKANFAEQAREQGTFQTFSIGSEIDYWNKVLATVRLNTKDRLTVETDINKLRLAADKQAYADELAGIKSQESQYKGNLQAKLAIAQDYAARIAKAEGGNSAAARTAAGEVVAIEREIGAQRLAIATTAQNAINSVRLSAIDAAERAVQAQAADELITNAQWIKQEKSFEDQRYAIKLDALQKTLALEAQDPDRNPAKLAEINAQILQLATAHAAAMSALDVKSTTDSAKNWKNLFDNMKSGFASTFSNFMKGTLTVAGAIKSLFQDIAGAIIGVLADIAAKWLATTIETAIFGKAAASTTIADNAAMAGSGAYAAIASIPWVGPALAPEAGMVAYAGAMSYQAGLAAEQGFDVPAGMNPVTQLHQKEMVLPAEHAETIRQMSAHGGGGGGKPVVFNINATDPKSLARQLMDGRSSISKALQKHLKGTGYSNGSRGTA